MFVINGITGKVGGRVGDILLEAGLPVLSLIHIWLKVPVEERDENGKPRVSGGKGSTCSPWPAPSPPPPPPKIAPHCSTGSQVLRRSPTPLERARPQCGYSPFRPDLDPGWVEMLHLSLIHI